MTPREVAGIALVAGLMLLAVGAVARFVLARGAARRERRWLVQVERGRRALLEVVRTGRLSRRDEAMLRELPVLHQVRLFTELVPALAGQSREQLGRLAREIGLVPAAEALVGSKRWRDRQEGVRLLSMVGGGEEVVPPLLDDPHPAVRAQAVEWVGSHPSFERVEKLVKLLPQAERYGGPVVRDTLLRIGGEAVAPLASFLNRVAGGALAQPALEVAAGIPDVRFAAAAVRLCRDPLPGVRARAAALAGAVGSEEAVAVLQGMLGDGDASVRAAAAGALGRLGHWPSASLIVPLLRDPEGGVRSQAALALRSLGSPGLLYLRRMAADEDPVAAKAARQVLEGPDGPAATP